MDIKLELVTLPVSDVDRAKAFYVDQVGFNADHDHRVTDEIRFVQLTPPGSACSIAIGTGLTDAEPGSVKGMQVVVDSAAAMRDALRAKGVETSDVMEFPWGTFIYFSDPDGNAWAGPFVMNTRDEVMQAFADYQAGRIGSIPAVHGAPTELTETAPDKPS